MADIESIIQESASAGSSLLQGAELEESDFVASTKAVSAAADRFESAAPLQAPQAEDESEAVVEQVEVASAPPDLRVDTVSSDEFLDLELDDLRDAGVSVASEDLREQAEFSVAIEAPVELQAAAAGLAIDVAMPESPAPEPVETIEPIEVIEPIEPIEAMEVIEAIEVMGPIEVIEIEKPIEAAQPVEAIEPPAMPELEMPAQPVVEPSIEIEIKLPQEQPKAEIPGGAESEASPVAIEVDSPIEQPIRAPSPLFVVLDGLGRPISGAKIHVKSAEAGQASVALVSDPEGLAFAAEPPSGACELTVSAKGYEKVEGLAWTSLESAYSPVEIRLKKAKSTSRIIIPRKPSKPKD